jgi:hypothetical protein
MIYTVSCHCGKIAIEAEGDIEQAVQCNCSICSKKGYLLWFVLRANLRLLTPESEIATYTFNRHNIQHHFCPTCGCAPFSEGTGPTGESMAAINVRCLDDHVDLPTLKIIPYDGRSK